MLDDAGIRAAHLLKGLLHEHARVIHIHLQGGKAIGATHGAINTAIGIYSDLAKREPTEAEEDMIAEIVEKTIQLPLPKLPKAKRPEVPAKKPKAVMRSRR